MPEPLLALTVSEWAAIASATFAALAALAAGAAATAAGTANRLAEASMKRQFDESVRFSGEGIERLDRYIEIHTRFVNDSQFAVRLVEVKLEDESRYFVAKRKSAPTTDQPVVLEESVPKEIAARQGRVFHVRWDPDAVTLDQRVRVTFRTDNDRTLHARWHEIPAPAGS